MNRYYVYIITSSTGTLYTGVTNHLRRHVEDSSAYLIESKMAGFE